ncbi:immunoglobulin-like domain-containing protein [Lacrimispora indolis]|uniref:immunoglobulin-like domain-containing protein n=1 Tax=Lacrimispora indolis TaxID=69825 RepID=UPI00041D1136|nr:immunoglobulin-like domain-containing protein [[Clostridium] methoxybenzovorans]
MSRKSEKKWRFPFTKAQTACAVSGIILYAVLELVFAAGGQTVSEGGGLKRAGPGKGETTYHVLVSGLDRDNGNKKVPVKIPVRERKYGEEEARELFQRIQPELIEQMLGENESLEEVRRDLNLKSSLRDYGLRIIWESDNPQVIDSFGILHNEDIPEEGNPVWLKARVTDGSNERRYEFLVMVYPPALTQEERAASDFIQWISGLDLKQQTEDRLSLPSVYEGKRLTYFLPGETDYRMLPVLGFLLAALLHVKEEFDRKSQAKLREQKLLFDYSEVVSKLVVYIGAGLTVRASWERIVAGYKEAVKQGKRSARPAYEEMMKTAMQLGSGLSEGRAYGEFGRRCGLQAYIKLSALLEQSQKNGSRQLRPALELEMASAFEQRKNLAKKLGEEAGTKLLLPLFMMLGVVMVMIVVPAFLAFY